MRSPCIIAAGLALVVHHIQGTANKASTKGSFLTRWARRSLRKLTGRKEKPEKVEKPADPDPASAEMDWFLARMPENTVLTEGRKQGPRLVESCSLSYIFSAKGDRMAGGDGGIVVGANVWLPESEPSKRECTLDYLYEWDNELRGLNRMRALLNVRSIISITQVLGEGLTCTQRLQRYGKLGLMSSRRQGNDSNFESDLLSDLTSALRGSSSNEKGNGNLASHVAEIKDQALEGNLQEVDLQQAPVFVREYVNSILKFVRLKTCPPVTARIGNEVVTVTLRVTSSGKLELHEIETIGSRSWSIDDFSKATADLLYGIQKRARQITTDNPMESCEQQLFKFGKAIEKHCESNNDNAKPALGDALNVSDAKEKSSQLEKAVTQIYQFLMGAC